MHTSHGVDLGSVVLGGRDAVAMNINEGPTASRQFVAQPPFWGSKVASITTPAWQNNFGKSYALMVVGILAFSAVLGGLFLGVQSLAENGSEWLQRAAGYGFQAVLLLLLSVVSLRGPGGLDGRRSSFPSPATA